MASGDFHFPRNFRPLKVAVVGCGTAGPAAAILLSRQGHEVELFERAPECRPVGAGFLLQPSGMAVLRELGIEQAVLAHAAKVDRLHIVNPDESTLLDLRYQEMDIRSFGAGLHRPVLLHHLLLTMKHAGVTCHWGWEVEDAFATEKGWEIRSVDEAKAGPFDLLIVADGARSTLRDRVGSGGRNRGYPWGAHWFIGENRQTFQQSELYQIVRGTRKLAGFLATGTTLDRPEPMVSLFWSIRLDRDAELRSRSLNAWKDGILRLCPRSEPLLDQIEDWSQITTARYGDICMSKWYGDRIVILGDAAHAMSPQLGQGVNLALADASCLADCLSREELPAALREYQRRRWLTIRYYQYATRWLTPLFQSDREWLAPVRSGFFKIARQLPPARHLMTRTMAGVIGQSGFE